MHRSPRLSLALMACTAGLLIFSADADARDARQNQVPNGTSFNCTLCHTSVAGGERNVFGMDVGTNLDVAGEQGEVVWSAIYNLDSDGDGITNGDELLDPDGTWVIGDANPAGTPTDPADADDPSTDAGPGGDMAGGCSSQSLPSSSAPLASLAFFGLAAIVLRRRR